jgi:hypothetical protein
MIVPMAGDAEAEDRVRRAVERLRGTRLAQQWPPGALSAGTRVSVVHDTAWAGPWHQVFTGTISGMELQSPSYTTTRVRVSLPTGWISTNRNSTTKATARTARHSSGTGTSGRSNASYEAYGAHPQAGTGLRRAPAAAAGA